MLVTGVLVTVTPLITEAPAVISFSNEVSALFKEHPN